MRLPWTGDHGAELEARRICQEHSVDVYMVEWDDNVDGDSDQLPEYIMKAIGVSRAFWVYVIQQVADSMWIGYEVGGAHAMGKPRAKIMYQRVKDLPSVVRALEPLESRVAVDKWIEDNV